MQIHMLLYHVCLCMYYIILEITLPLHALSIVNVFLLALPMLCVVNVLDRVNLLLSKNNFSSVMNFKIGVLWFIVAA